MPQIDRQPEQNLPVAGAAAQIEIVHGDVESQPLVCLILDAKERGKRSAEAGRLLSGAIEMRSYALKETGRGQRPSEADPEVPNARRVGI